MQQPHNAGILDFCITSSLLIVASRCRESALRHKALNLLRDARRGQGVWVTKELEGFAHAVVGVEVCSSLALFLLGVGCVVLAPLPTFLDRVGRRSPWTRWRGESVYIPTRSHDLISKPH